MLLGTAQRDGSTLPRFCFESPSFLGFPEYSGQLVTNQQRKRLDSYEKHLYHVHPPCDVVITCPGVKQALVGRRPNENKSTALHYEEGSGGSGSMPVLDKVFSVHAGWFLLDGSSLQQPQHAFNNARPQYTTRLDFADAPCSASTSEFQAFGNNCSRPILFLSSKARRLDILTEPDVI